MTRDSRAANNKHKKQPDLLNPRHIQTRQNRQWHNQQRHIGNRIRDRRRNIQALLVNAGAIDAHVPRPRNRFACEDQRKCNGHAISYHDCRNYVQAVSEDLSLGDDAMVEDDEGGFGEGQGGDVDDTGDEDGLDTVVRE